MSQTPAVRIAHLSDLHIGFLSHHLKDWLSKAVIAQLNYLFNIHRRFNANLLQIFPEVLRSLQISHVLISGDFTTAGSESEFLTARAFLEQLLDKGLKVLIIPGNHDHYTKREMTSGFYRHLYPLMRCSGQTLFKNRFERIILSDNGDNPWDIWLLDQVEPTPWISSQGNFDPSASSALGSAMREQSNPHGNTIVCGHFPLHNTARRSRVLVGRRSLRETLSKQKSVRLYAHGHTHQFHIFDERPKRQAISIDAGSATQRGRAGFMLYDLEPKKVEFRRYTPKPDISLIPWKEGPVHTWTWP